MARIPRVTCHLFDYANHHGHAYRRGDQLVHCPGRHEPGKQYVSTRRRAPKTSTTSPTTAEEQP